MQSQKKIVDLLRDRGWLTAGQLGQIVDISQTYIRTLIKNDEIIAIQVGGLYRVYADEIIKVLFKYNKEHTQYARQQALEAASNYLRDSVRKEPTEEVYNDHVQLHPSKRGD